ncbi:Uncharacterised protein [uncultured archaeon]|nr:Uncharacterised protein [uncultured archaeon]
MARRDEQGFLELEPEDEKLLERYRVEALSGQNAERYQALTDFFGFNPEDENLYRASRGIHDAHSLVETLLGVPPFIPPKRTDISQTLLTSYQSFLKEAEGVSNSLYQDPDTKRRLLETYFPGRFGSKGKQPLMGASPGKIGYLFNALIESARKALKED